MCGVWGCGVCVVCVGVVCVVCVVCVGVVCVCVFCVCVCVGRKKIFLIFCLNVSSKNRIFAAVHSHTSRLGTFAKWKKSGY